MGTDQDMAQGAGQDTRNAVAVAAVPGALRKVD